MQPPKHLRLRWSTPNDTEKIALAASQGFAGSDGLPTPRTAEIVRRLMRGDCPAMSPQDFCLIEDISRSNHPIVACLCLQHFEWTYEGIPLSIARPEMVTSLPDYRQRGLVRTLFAEMHRKTQGDDLQAIVGIPYFYHKMGYEYALDLEGKRVAPVSSLPEHINDEPYTLHDATISDIPFLQQWYNRRQGDYLLWATMTDEQWRYYINDTQRSHDKAVRCIKIIVDARGVPQGFLITHPMRWWKTLDVYVLELNEETNWSNATPSLLSALKHYGETMPTEEADTEAFTEIEFVLGRTHPAYEGLGTLAPIWQRPDAWYIRVPDISRLLRRIVPALERHLNNSELAGYNGELKVNLYQGGVHLGFEHGHISFVKSWQKDLYTYNADVSMAPHQLWQLMLGYRSLDQLLVDADAPDLLVNEKEATLLNALFPTRPSFVFRIEFK